MHQVIKYEKTGIFLITQCPNGKEIMVGGYYCEKCDHFCKKIEAEVTCSFNGDLADLAMDHKEDGPNV